MTNSFYVASKETSWQPCCNQELRLVERLYFYGCLSQTLDTGKFKDRFLRLFEEHKSILIISCFLSSHILNNDNFSISLNNIISLFVYVYVCVHIQQCVHIVQTHILLLTHTIHKRIPICPGPVLQSRFGTGRPLRVSFPAGKEFLCTSFPLSINPPVAINRAAILCKVTQE